jgi:hypothetical protein
MGLTAHRKNHELSETSYCYILSLLPECFRDQFLRIADGMIFLNSISVLSGYLREFRYLYMPLIQITNINVISKQTSV